MLKINKQFWGSIGGDRVIWGCIILLSLISVLLVSSSTEAVAYQKGLPQETLVLKHIILLGAGFALIIATMRVNYKWFSPISRIGLWISIFLLIITIFSGTNVNSSSRWLKIPFIGITFQTSDLAKLCLFIVLARELHLRQETIKKFKSGMLHLLKWVIPVCALVVSENFSTAALIFLTSCIVMYIGRVPIGHILGFIGIIIIITSFFLLVAKVSNLNIGRTQTWISRLENFSQDDKSEKSYQSKQTLIAIARGGLVGVGPGNSLQKHHLPNSHSDFIYAIILEEYGLIGGVFVMLIYLVLLFRTIWIATKTQIPFGALLASGLCVSLVLQAFTNMAVAVQLLPVTGLNLPLISTGGTSLLFTGISLGIILSVSKEAISQDKKLNQPSKIKVTEAWA